MTEAPAPLTPSDCDLRAYSWFPFHYRRLRQSAWWKRASDTACRISVDLWAEAYEQVPAGSLPNDDHTLADWAGFGRRDLNGWLAVKDEVLSAWVLCSDGRWYHPTLCEVAREAWAKHLEHLRHREGERTRKEAYRARKASERDTPQDNDDCPTGQPEVSRGTPADVTAENALTRTRTGTSIPVGTGAPSSDPNKEAWTRGAALLCAAGEKPTQARTFFGKLLKDNALEGRDLLPSIVKAESLGTADPKAYLTKAARAVAERRSGLRAPAAPTVEEWDHERWVTAIRLWRQDGSWSTDWGPAPDQAACRAPADLLGGNVIPLRAGGTA